MFIDSCRFLLIFIILYRFELIFKDLHRFSSIPSIFIDLKGSGARIFGGLRSPEIPCAGLWRQIGSPIRNISRGLEDVVDGWEEGTGRTED